MCSTEIVQRKLREAGKGLSSKVPSTYPEALQKLLRRNIVERNLDSVATSELPLFVKPVSNDKAFDGKVLRDEDDLEGLRAEVRKLAVPSAGCKAGTFADSDMGCQIYSAKVVKFFAEYRLFIGGGRLYGLGKIRDAGSAGTGPSEEFLGEVMSACGD